MAVVNQIIEINEVDVDSALQKDDLSPTNTINPLNQFKNTQPIKVDYHFNIKSDESDAFANTKLMRTMRLQKKQNVNNQGLTSFYSSNRNVDSQNNNVKLSILGQSIKLHESKSSY